MAAALLSTVRIRMTSSIGKIKILLSPNFSGFRMFNNGFQNMFRPAYSLAESDCC
jgi:hypothetical protein